MKNLIPIPFTAFHVFATFSVLPYYFFKIVFLSVVRIEIRFLKLELVTEQSPMKSQIAKSYLLLARAFLLCILGLHFTYELKCSCFSSWMYKVKYRPYINTDIAFYILTALIKSVDAVLI